MRENRIHLKTDVAFRVCSDIKERMESQTCLVKRVGIIAVFLLKLESIRIRVKIIIRVNNKR